MTKWHGCDDCRHIWSILDLIDEPRRHLPAPPPCAILTIRRLFDITEPFFVAGRLVALVANPLVAHLNFLVDAVEFETGAYLLGMIVIIWNVIELVH